MEKWMSCNPSAEKKEMNDQKTRAVNLQNWEHGFYNICTVPDTFPNSLVPNSRCQMIYHSEF